MITVPTDVIMVPTVMIITLFYKFGVCMMSALKHFLIFLFNINVATLGL